MRDDDIFGGVIVSISGIHEEDGFVRDNVQGEISKALGKLSRVMEVTDFSMHVRKYHEEGNRAKYSVHGKIITAESEFYAEDFAWELEKAVKGLLDKLEKEMLRHAEKAKDHGRAH
ncbi:MAG: HPF/RaiA family ribosome-associated protein [Candidatus Aenigmarchaeota archaeon]|nr:HPF/RaiA family ribosome-associated protein [Candidatus Aenigmarchaeota archaeon]